MCRGCESSYWQGKVTDLLYFSIWSCTQNANLPAPGASPGEQLVLTRL